MRVMLLLLVLCAVLLVSGLSDRVCGREEKEKAAAGTEHKVTMTNKGGTNKFDPAEITIKVGDWVKWVNEGGSHTATSDDFKTGNPKKTFNTGRVDKGQEASVPFNAAGTYTYHCEFHPGMKGKITVE
jgi:plastocyanin